VLEGDGGGAVVDDQAVLIQVDAHLVVQLGAGAQGVDHDREQTVVARLDLVVQVEVDEQQTTHVGHFGLVHVAVPVHAPDVLGLPSGVGLVGPDDQEAGGFDGEGAALGVVVVELERDGPELLGGLLAAAGGALGILDGDGVGHDGLAPLRGQDLELALDLLTLDDVGLVLLGVLDDLADRVRALALLDLLHLTDLGLGGGGLAGGEGQGGEGQDADGTHGCSDARRMNVRTCWWGWIQRLSSRVIPMIGLNQVTA